MLKRSYKDIRDDIQTGDIILFSGKGIFSRLIRWFTKSKYSHVGMAVRMPEYDMVLIWESTTLSKTKDVITGTKTKGVQVVSLSERVQGYRGKVVWRKLSGELSKDQLYALLELRHELRGKPYERSRLELLLAGIPNINMGNENLRSVFCSELIAEAYQRAYLLPEHPPSNSYAPERFSQDSENSVKLTNGFALLDEVEIRRSF